MTKIARKRREWYPHAMYHIMGRGNHRTDIFRDETDYAYMLALLRYVKEKYDFELHSYCLMTNHYHFLLETKDTEVWKIMKYFVQGYTGFYNDKYKTDGHLFRGRYHAILVENDMYFLQTSRYIHLNPVKARMVQHPEEYPYSSYRDLIGMEYGNFVSTQKIWSFFHSPQNVAYRLFVEENPDSVEAYELAIQKSMKEDDLWLPW